MSDPSAIPERTKKAVLDFEKKDKFALIFLQCGSLKNVIALLGHGG